MSGVVKIQIARLYQREGIETHPAPGCDLVVELSHTAAAEIPGVLISDIREVARSGRLRFQFGVDLFKIRIPDHRLAAQHDRLPAGDPQREILEHARVVRDDFADLAVSSGHRFLQCAGFIRENDREPVQFPGEEPVAAVEPVLQRVPVLGLIQR